MTAQNQCLSACIRGSYLRSPQRFRNGAARAAAACFFALALSAVASAQNLSCPVSSDVTVSATLNNVASSCIVDFGVTLTIGSTGDLVNVGPSGSGILENNGTFLNDGDFENKPLQTFTNFGTVFNNNTMDMGGGTFTNASIFDNFGAVADDAFGDGILNNAATFTNDGTMGLADTVNNSVGAHFNNAGFLSLSLGNSVFAPVTTNNGILTNLTGAVLENGTTFTNNGSLINDGTLANGKSLTPFANFEQATLTNNGTITNNSTGTITNTGALGQFIENNGTFDNYGTLVNGSSVSNSVLDIFDNNNGGNLINEKGASLTITGGEFRDEGALTNNGAITINGGLLFVASSETLNNTAGSTYLQTSGFTEIEGKLNSVPAVQIQGGALFGFGTINGNVNNSGGIVEPGDGGSPGFLTINGNYQQSSGGTMTIQLEGTSPSDFGVLDVTGLSALDGTVDFETVGGFTPIAGDDFTFFLFGSLSGNFSNIDFTGCPTGDTCALVLGANSLSLDITGPQTAPTPEPSSLLLLGTGILLIARCFRWKRVPGVR